MIAQTDGFPASPIAAASKGTIFGHPKGLAFLAFTEVWERFSFYGMSGLLVLYMVQYLLTPGTMDGVYALNAFKASLETITGPMSQQAFASQIFGIYSGFVYFTPVFGGMLADRLLGQRFTVILGAITLTAGHIFMAFDFSFLFALLLLIVGTGLLKGNISAQVGHLYSFDEESRRTQAFAIFSAAINLGALCGPVACGILAQIYGWHVGFGFAGFLMIIALLTYIAGWKYLPPDRKRTKSSEPTPPLTRSEWRIIAALIMLTIISIFPAVAYYQEMNVGLLFFEASVDRQFFGWTIPTSSFPALDGFFCIIFVPLVVGLWRWQKKRGSEPGDMSKVAIGYILAGAANALMIIPAARADHGGAMVSILWPIGLHALNSLGFLYYWPTLLALFSRSAPKQVNATMMGILFMSLFFGNLMKGAIGGWWEQMSHASFFAVHVGLAVGAAVAMIILKRPMEKLLKAASDKETAFH